MALEPSGNAHGVFLLNSNAMGKCGNFENLRDLLSSVFAWLIIILFFEISLLDYPRLYLFFFCHFQQHGILYICFLIKIPRLATGSRGKLRKPSVLTCGMIQSFEQSFRVNDYSRPNK